MNAQIAKELGIIADKQKIQYSKGDLGGAAFSELQAWKYIKTAAGEDYELWNEWCTFSHETKALCTGEFRSADHSRMLLGPTQDSLKARKVVIPLPNASNMAHEQWLKGIAKSGSDIQDILLLLPHNHPSTIPESYYKGWVEACGNAAFIHGSLKCDPFNAGRWIVQAIAHTGIDINECVIVFCSVLQWSFWAAVGAKHESAGAAVNCYINLKLPIYRNYPVFDSCLLPTLQGFNRSQQIDWGGAKYFPIYPRRTSERPPVAVTKFPPYCARHIDAKRIYIGSIDREEKKRSESFFHQLDLILRSDLRLTYLWTDRKNDIFDRLSERYPGRVCHIGWIEPREFLKLIDIYIEPLPWGGGLMSYLALAAGKPFISSKPLSTTESYGGIYRTIAQVRNNLCENSLDNLWPLMFSTDAAGQCNAVQEYIEVIIRSPAAGIVQSFADFYQNHIYPVAEEFI